MEQNNKHSSTKWVVLVVLAILLSACLGALAGGAAGFWAGRRVATRMERRWTLPVPRTWVTPSAPNRPRSGVPTPQTPESQLPTISGALVTEVVQGSPAASAGIQANDILTAIDGESVSAANTPQALVGKHRPGDTVKITLHRANQERTLEVQLGSSPTNSDAAYLGIRYLLEPRVDDPSTH